MEKEPATEREDGLSKGDKLFEHLFFPVSSAVELQRTDADVCEVSPDLSVHRSCFTCLS